MTPAWILDIFAALMLAVAAVSAGRLVAARSWQRGSLLIDTDVAHLLMAIAMAGMLASSLATLPNTAWDVIFALLTAWFAFRVFFDARANGVRALAGGHCAPHLVHSAAMLYMFDAVAAPVAGGSGMSGMGGASAPAMHALRYPTLAFAFALILIGYSIWDLDQLSGRRYSTAPSRVPLARVAVAVPAMAGAGAATATATVPGPQATGVTAASGVPSGSAAAEVAGSAGDGPGGGSTAGAILLSPATTVGCRIAMGVTMALMLLVII
jgi:Domain of unknown function (DUF5134)